MAQASPGFIASQFVVDRAEIERLFRLFRDQCAAVQLRFGRTQHEYDARVLDVTPAQILLEDIRPRTGMRLMRDQEPFALTGRLDGIYVRVDETRVAEIVVDRGVPYFALSLPTEILYQQRRRAERFRLPLSVTKEGARITLHRADRMLSGYLVDISAGGCRVVFDVKSDPQILQDEVVARCGIEIPNLLKLSASAIIRHQSLNKQTGQLVCGIEFSEMPIGDRRRLEQLIGKLAKLTETA